MKKVNRERKAKRDAEAFAAQAELCRTLDCSACGAWGPSDPAHVRSRGAGGKDRGNVIPLCRVCHMQQHAWGWPVFAERTGIDPDEIACRLETLAYPD